MLRRTLARVRAAPVRLDPAWRAALDYGLATRLGLAVWAGWIWLQGLMPTAAGGFYFSVAPILDGWQGVLVGMWQRWDAIHYQAIAEQFYTPELSVFFPAYPLLGRALSQAAGISAPEALLWISAASALFSFALLYRIAAALFSPAAARRAVACAALFPTSFFLYGIFPQSILLLSMLIAYDQAGRRRWLAAGLAGLLAGLTHGSGAILTVMLAVMAAEQMGLLRPSAASTAVQGTRVPIEKTRRRTQWLRGAGMLAAAAMPVLGVALFLAWREAMGFPGYSFLQETQHARIFSAPWETLWELVVYLPTNVSHNWVILLNLAVLALAIWSVVGGWRGWRTASGRTRLPVALNVFQAALLVYFLTSRQMDDPLLSLNRYILGMFPLYLALGAAEMGRLGRMATFALGVFGSLGISALFFLWKWVG